MRYPIVQAPVTASAAAAGGGRRWWLVVKSEFSYKKFGVFNLDIETPEEKDFLIKLNREYSFDWLKPSDGPSFNLGSEISILVYPEDAPSVREKINAQCKIYLHYYFK